MATNYNSSIIGRARVCMCVFVTALSGIYQSGPSSYRGNCHHLPPLKLNITVNSCNAIHLFASLWPETALIREMNIRVVAEAGAIHRTSCIRLNQG